MPLLGLAALVAAVLVYAVSQGASTPDAVRSTGVLGTQATRTSAAHAHHPRVHALPRAASRATVTLAVGARAAEHSVRVLDVVGPEIFWIGKDTSQRTLVHLQGPGTRWGIRPGQRLTFTAVVARNRPAVAARWGLTRREGRDQFSRQAVHLEVYGPRIRFRCVSRCR
jgi:hypothetical protein